MSNSSLSVSFSSINLRFLSPQGTQFPQELLAFRTEDFHEFDAQYEIQLLQKPFDIIEEPTYSHGSLRVYTLPNGQLRIYSLYDDSDRCQVACFLTPNGQNRLLYPASHWDSFSAPLHCLPYLAPEVFLLRKDAFLLHSSIISWRGKAILFAGASGTGKSTQADLWKTHMHADIINGDRCIVMKKGNCFFGGGSPWCGSSGIYDPRQFPIAAIVLPVKGNRNKLTPLTRGAFPALLSQTLVDRWDTHFMQKLTDLYAELLSSVPVFQLECMPDRNSVDLVAQAVFGKECKCPSSIAH